MDSELRYKMIIGIAVMFLLFTGFLITLIFSQRKQLKYQKAMERLREQQQNQLIEAAIQSEEQERHRIAETLHDEVGAILSSVKLHLLGIKSEVLDDKDQHLHEKGRQLLNEVIQKVRGISHNLHSNILKEFGLNEAIIHFLNKITSGSQIHSSTSLDDNYKSQNADTDISLYRIFQELMNNILKYANASKLQVGSQLMNDKLELVISHNGKGLTQEQFEELRYRKEGLGLKNIQNRIILLKGNIRFNCGIDGCSISIQVPLKTNEQHVKN